MPTPTGLVTDQPQAAEKWLPSVRLRVALRELNWSFTMLAIDVITRIFEVGRYLLDWLGPPSHRALFCNLEPSLVHSRPSHAERERAGGHGDYPGGARGPIRLSLECPASEADA